MVYSIEGKRILVTGCCGTVGSEIVRLLLRDHRYSPAGVTGIDNNESQLFFIDQEHSSDRRASFFLADVRDRDVLVKRMEGVDVVFHAAALKHVILCEKSPYEAAQTNVMGVQNILTAAAECGVQRVIFTSSDKAVNPTSVMGTSKLMGERLTTAANSTQRGGSIFASTRFGNVLGSSGSVIPLFRKQIAAGGPVTLTDPGMTRFIMTVEQSVRLVIDSVALARGGEVFITKMPTIRIKDLAEVMIAELAGRFGHDPANVAITEIGAKAGEKLYEELMSDEETRRGIELEQYFVVLPAFRSVYRDIEYDYPGVVSDRVSNPYVSAREPAMGKGELSAFLRDNGLLAQPGIPL